MTARRIGLVTGVLAFVLTLLLPPPAGMPAEAWLVAGLVVWMAAWWMTEALPLTATALLPFLAFPLFGIMSASETAAAYYSPILFLVLGGAIIALAIERTGLHRRLALAIVARGGASPAAMGTPARIVRQTDSRMAPMSTVEAPCLQVRAAATSLVQAFQVSSPRFLRRTS